MIFNKKNKTSYIYIFLISIIIAIIIAIIVRLYKIKTNTNVQENFNDLKEEEAILLPIPNENIKSVYIRENIKPYEIPSNIFTCWHTKNLPPKMNKTISQIKEENPEFNIYVFDNNDCRNMIEKYFIKSVLNAYDSLNADAYKSDLWRYCVLYLYGGIYQDIKFKPINNFKYKKLTDKEYFAKDRDEGGKGILNGFIVCKKNNKILEKAIKQIIENVKNKYYGKSSLEPTGPLLLKNFFSEDTIDNLEMKLIGDINNISDMTIVKKDSKILKMYDGYRDEQKQFGTKHYGLLWSSGNSYK
jgi:mannosyltransferase OCH1-like enzyme